MYRLNRLWIAAAVSFPLLAGAQAAPAPTAASESISQETSVPVESVPVEIVRTPEERLDRVERMLASQSLMQMLNRIDQLQQEVQQLRGEIEMQTHSLNGVQQRQRDLYLDMDRRLRRVETSGLASSSATDPAATSTPSADATTPPTQTDTVQTTQPTQVTSTTPATTTAAIDPVQERKDYQIAFNLLKESRYEEAITAFQGFLKSHPTGSYADNAQYWLGEVRYVSRDFTGAIEDFHKVLEDHPDSPKVADAMLKLGYARYELGEWNQSRAVLEDVVQRFPGTTTARLANKRLERLTQEGH